MKKTILLMSILASSLSFYSCQEEALETEPTEFISNPETKFKVNGLYTLMIKTGTGGSAANLRHDDYGQKGYDVYTDLIESDVVMDGVTYGWYSALANYSGVLDNSTTENYRPWVYYYKMVYAANDIIDDYKEGQELTVDERHYIGQAKGVRAYAYFYLLQMYTKQYDASGDAIPLVTNTSMTVQPKSKQSDIYKLIVDDLKAAQTDLADFQRNNKARMNKDVATGLLAYTYAAMGEDALAATEAAKIVNSAYPITSKQDVAYNPADLGSYGGFNNLASPSWLWGYDITSENGLDLVSWWGQMDIFTYSYASVG
ncbi:RagB/SusD family nutrient uptake outer membrane protein, partial [Algoriella sp.]|uniref:RagB/SusD family nutrient uptake outer membrane protein n=1 Tax=Algoriella sp. TaxID=1872434 RepID=UPI001B04C435